MAGVLVVAAYVVVGATRLVRVVAVTRGVGARRRTVLVCGMRVV
jgi:predicted lysophospholipase L1 biosynthesis ABC-type transport system permease subunit